MTRAVQAVTLAFLATMVAGLVWSAETRAYNPDEFQHVQIAWLIAQGQVPNREFFEHHTYLWHLLASLSLGDPRIARDGDAAVAALLHLRHWGIALAAFAIVLTERLGRELFDPLTARLGALALACSAIFLMLALEIRPDQLALCLLLITSIALARLARSPRVALWSALAGATAALAVLTTQKIVFAGPGLAATLAVTVWLRGEGWRPLTVSLLAGGLAAAAVVASFALWLTSHGALAAFIHENFLLGASWVRDSRSLILIVADTVRDETLLCVLAAIGGLGLFLLKRRDWMWRWAALAPMLSLVALLPVFPVVQRQYLLLALPYASLLAGYGLTKLISWIDAPKLARTAGALLLTGGVAVHGALALKTQQTAKDDTALRVLRYIVERTPVDATVLRSWSPGIAFRKPASRYFSLHQEIRALVPLEEWTAITRRLSGSAAPVAVEMDRFMRENPPSVVAAIERNYVEAGVGNLWVRKAQVSTAAP